MSKPANETGYTSKPADNRPSTNKEDKTSNADESEILQFVTAPIHRRPSMMANSSDDHGVSLKSSTERPVASSYEIVHSASMTNNTHKY